jgi:hypothetical protein
MVYVHTICLKPGSGFIITSSKMNRVTEDVSGLTGNKMKMFLGLLEMK